MGSEGHRRSTVNEAEGAAESVRLKAEAEAKRIKMIAGAEAERTKMIAEAEAAKTRMNAEATAESLKNIAQALETKGGKNAMVQRLSEQYVGELANMAKNSKMVIVPDKPNNVAGVVATALGMVDSMKDNVVEPLPTANVPQ